MAVYTYGDRVPSIGRRVYISDSARVIGDVVIGDDCYVGHGAVIRGDYGTIHLGSGTAVEENAVVHVRPKGLSVMGRRVTIGHGAVVHCNRIGDFAVVGMGAVLSFDVELGEWSVVAEGCVVPNKTIIPSRKVVVGVPARVVGDVGSEHKSFWTSAKQSYVDLAHSYREKIKRID